MGYLSKKAVLTAYESLSHLTADARTQGATQKVSALRYFIALDQFYNKNQKACDTTSSIDKDAFTSYVGSIVSLNELSYTTNFYYPLKDSEGDYNCGSNFYSVNVVKESKANPIQIHDFPRRGGYPLIKVQDGKLLKEDNYYKNLNHYLNEKSYSRASLVVWLVRNILIANNNYEGIKQAMLNRYSLSLVNLLMPKSEEFEYIKYLDFADKPPVIEDSDIKQLLIKEDVSKNSNKDHSIYRQYITALKSKPFMLLAGISGTGKSRIVRELARSCWDEESEEYTAQKPKNFEMVQVKPNWHDSSELLGYVSRVSGEPQFIIGSFLQFIAEAWKNEDIPYFLCLDEMNLAPVEQYFAEYLSVIESRKCNDNGKITTDPIIRKNKDDWYRVLTSDLADGNDALRNQFLSDGISIPQNLIVIGTVNMDETTFSFSRKVLDRAMTIEMNEVDLYGGLSSKFIEIGKIKSGEIISEAVEGVDVYSDYTKVCNIVLDYLGKVNNELNHTPFKIAYRTRNEFLLFIVNNLRYNEDEKGNDLSESVIIARALDEITSMKILARIEGDDTKVSKNLLDTLSTTISNGLNAIVGEGNSYESKVSLPKLEEMKERLESGYTSFWS